MPLRLGVSHTEVRRRRKLRTEKGARMSASSITATRRAACECEQRRPARARRHRPAARRPHRPLHSAGARDWKTTHRRRTSRHGQHERLRRQVWVDGRGSDGRIRDRLPRRVADGPPKGGPYVSIATAPVEIAVYGVPAGRMSTATSLLTDGSPGIDAVARLVVCTTCVWAVLSDTRTTRSKYGWSP